MGGRGQCEVGREVGRDVSSNCEVLVQDSVQQDGVKQESRMLRPGVHLALG
jgi:hypothetical protein